MSQRPGGAFSVLDMATLINEHDSIPIGPGPDQAMYVWFENGKAKFHSEH